MRHKVLSTPSPLFFFLCFLPVRIIMEVKKGFKLKHVHKFWVREREKETCRKRRKGLGGPFEMGVCWLEECRHESLPLLPQMTLHPGTRSSKHHKSGFFCQSTNPPTSSLLVFNSTHSSSPPPCWKSEALILTCPVTHMLCTEFNAGCPPVAAVYCCTIYFAVEASCNKWHEIQIASSNHYLSVFTIDYQQQRIMTLNIYIYIYLKLIWSI